MPTTLPADGRRISDPEGGHPLRLGGPSTSAEPGRDASTVADGLRSAARSLGQRPAITVLRPERRDEQGHTSILRWTAKGAHLLRDEWGVGDGDLVRVDAPADWTTAVVCLSTWWVGAVVVIAASREAALRVAHEARVGTGGGEPDLVVGDAIDGGPAGDAAAEAWTHAARIHADEPPTPHGDGDAPAVLLGDGTSLTQRDLLDEAMRWGATGTLGLDRASGPSDWLPALVRPFLTGVPTVVLAGSDPTAAERERVEVWVGR